MKIALLALLCFVSSQAGVQAAEPQTYEMMATLSLPAGPAGVLLPADVVAGDAEALAQTLRLQDATGAERKFTVLTSRSSDAGEVRFVEWTPDDRPDDPEGSRAWLLSASDVPLDALRVSMDDYAAGPWRAQLYKQAGGGWSLVGEDQFLYAWQGGPTGSLIRNTLDIPHLRGPFRLVVRGKNSPTVASIDGTVYAADHVAPLAEELSVEGPIATERGEARYTIRLPGMRALSGIRLHVDDAIFARWVTLSGLNADSYTPAFQIERAMVGDVRIDETAFLDIPAGAVTDRIYIDVADGRDQPLAIRGATVYSVGALLVTPDAGPAPQTLYFGGTEPDSGSDIAIAADELARIATKLPADGVVGAVNPLFVPRATREGLDAPGLALNLTLWPWERVIEGAPGWVRVPIGSGDLAHARWDRADVRVVDAAGRSIPYELQRDVREVELTLGPPVRTESGSDSELLIPLPEGTGSVRRVELRTEQAVFSRTVELLRDRGSMTEALRSVLWTSTGSPAPLSLDVNAEVGSALLIRIQNGDDAPLPVTGVRAWSEEGELQFRMPEGGARLVYGNRRASAPDFDVSMVMGSRGRAPIASAVLGAEQRAAGVPMSSLDVALVYVAFGGLAIGLVALAIGGLRGTPVPDRDPVSPATPGAPPAPSSVASPSTASNQPKDPNS